MKVCFDNIKSDQALQELIMRAEGNYNYNDGGQRGKAS